MFININFISGYISAVDSQLEFESCTFNEFVLYGMSNTFVDFYHLQDKREAVWDITFAFQIQCNFIIIIVRQCHWNFIDDPETILVDMPRQNGIQLICDKAEMNITGTFMGDKEVYVRLNTAFKFYMHETVFDGRGSKSVLPGGSSF